MRHATQPAALTAAHLAAFATGDYARLARRNVPSAQAMLREVERKDLPRLTERANAVFDRVHRGTIIDLAVAREMMALDVADDEALAETGPLQAPA